MASKVGLAVYGLSREGFSRLGALLGATPNLQLRWVVDADPQRAARDLEKALPAGQRPEVIKPWSWDHLCKDKGLRGVLICSTLPAINMLRKALSSGLGVMCEHPISLQQEAVKACYEAAGRTNTPLLFAFNKRFDPMLSSIRSRVLSGALGRVYSVRSAACYNPLPLSGPEDQSAVFRDCLAEEVDAITWILNESPNTVFATGSGMACTGRMRQDADSVAMTMRFPSGILATMDCSRVTCQHDTHMEINGSHGVMMVDPHHPEGTAIHTISKDGTHTEVLTEPLEQRRHSAFTRATQHFLRVIQGEEDPALTSLDVLRATNIASAGLQSHLSNVVVARDTERHVRPPEELVKEPLWDEVPNSYNGIMPPMTVAQ